MPESGLVPLGTITEELDTIAAGTGAEMTIRPAE
jgi:hypothetical protein